MKAAKSIIKGNEALALKCAAIPGYDGGRRRGPTRSASQLPPFCLHDRNSQPVAAIRRAARLDRGAARRQPDDSPRRGVRHHRPQRCRQEHAGAHHQPAHAPQRGQRGGGRPRPDRVVGGRSARRAPRHRHDLPAFQPAVLAHRLRERGPAARAGRREASGNRGDRAAPAGAGGADGAEGSLPGPDQRRPEAARGHRAGAGQQAQGAAVGRGDLGARPGNDACDPRPAAQDQPATGPHTSC